MSGLSVGTALASSGVRARRKRGMDDLFSVDQVGIGDAQAQTLVRHKTHRSAVELQRPGVLDLEDDPGADRRVLAAVLRKLPVAVSVRSALEHQAALALVLVLDHVGANDAPDLFVADE